jgi:hypothetical protein
MSYVSLAETAEEADDAAPTSGDVAAAIRIASAVLDISVPRNGPLGNEQEPRGPS